MARIPNPNDLQKRGINPSMRAARINPSVASELGRARSAIGTAVANLAGAIGSVAGRASQAEARQNDARYNLEFNQGLSTIQTQLEEDGTAEAYEQAPAQLESLTKSLDEKYPTRDDAHHLKREARTFPRIDRFNRRAHRQYQSIRQRDIHKGEQDVINGAAASITADPSDENYHETLRNTMDLVNSNGVPEDGGPPVYSRQQLKERSEEVQETLSGARINALLKKDPEAVLDIIEKSGSSSKPEDKAGGAKADTVEKGKTSKVLEEYQLQNLDPTHDWTKSAGSKRLSSRDLGKVTIGVAHDTSGSGGRVSDAENVPRNYHVMFDKDGVYKMHGLERKAPHAASLNATSIGLSRRAMEGAPIGDKELLNAAKSILMVEKELGRKIDWKTHPELGKAGTRSGKDKREGAWLGEALKLARRLESGGINARSEAALKMIDSPSFAGLEGVDAEIAHSLLPKFITISEDGSPAVDGETLTSVGSQLVDGEEGSVGGLSTSGSVEIADGDVKKLVDANPEAVKNLAKKFAEENGLDAKDVEDHMRGIAEGSEEKIKTAKDLSQRFFAAGRPRADKIFETVGKDGKTYSFTGREINTLRGKGLKIIEKHAKERLKVVKKQQQSIVKSSVENTLISIEKTGQHHESFSEQEMMEVYKDNPNALATAQRRIATEQRAYELTEGANDLPLQTLQDRISEASKEVGRSGDNTVVQGAIDKAEAKVKKIAKLRKDDPASAVHNSEEVQGFLKDAEGKNLGQKAMLSGLVDARVKAQDRLGVERTPITKKEAENIMAPLRDSLSKRDRLKKAEEIVVKANDIFGENADAVIKSAVRLVSEDTARDRARMGRKLDRLNADKKRSGIKQGATKTTEEPAKKFQGRVSDTDDPPDLEEPDDADNTSPAKTVEEIKSKAVLRDKEPNKFDF